MDAKLTTGRTVQIRPDFVAAHYVLGNTLVSQGKLDEAAGQYRRGAGREQSALGHAYSQAIGSIQNGLVRSSFETVKPSAQRCQGMLPFVGQVCNLPMW